ncbi:MAG: CPBP family intramembrane glutamic endopeptidase [Polyangiaceae bacterium]|nr:CPBP family intramembrane glutamic endopeptidase [Polyangiaceae bacterium]
MNPETQAHVGRSPQARGLRAQPDSTSSVNLNVPSFWQMWLFVLIDVIVGGLLMAACSFAYGHSPTARWSIVISEVLTAVIMLRIARRWAKRPWVDILPLKPFKPTLLPALTATAIGLAPVLGFIGGAVESVIPIPKWVEEVIKQAIGTDPTVIAVSAVLIAPIVEESIFRGFVFSGFIRRYMPQNAVLLSALGFALVHANPWQFPVALGLGLVLGWVRLGSGSLWPCFFLHAIYNGCWTLAGLVGGIPGLVGATGEVHWVFAAAGVFVATAGLWWVGKILAIPSVSHAQGIKEA